MRNVFLSLLLTACCAASCLLVHAGEPNAAVQPWQDDAELRDVQFIGSKVAYAAGDHGVVWRTIDGGVTWLPFPVDADVSLRSVSFLTTQMGYVAGVEWLPYAGMTQGAMFVTSDGGETWDRCGSKPLPALDYVRFFTPEVGVAVGRTAPQAPSGVLRTSDGGETWQSFSGSGEGWLAAAFLAPELGIVAGREGRLSLVGGEQLLASRVPQLGSRAIRGVSLATDESGWIVGEGGLVLTTSTGGVVWQPPNAELPTELRYAFDFECVEQRGRHVWIAGSPGSVVWHSPDAGVTWERQPTGQTVPVHRLRFINDKLGFAVGALGTILATSDSGTTWTPVRGGQRRAAWLAIAPRLENVITAASVRLATEDGYRGAVWVVTAEEARAGAIAPEEALQGAIHASRGNAASVGWLLRLDRPDLLTAGDQLLQHWQRATENRAPQRLVDALTRQIRTWQPDVILLPATVPGETLGTLIQQATLAAIEQSGDATRNTELAELTGLRAHRPSRVYLQQPTGSEGDVVWNEDDYLPYAANSLRNLTRPADMLLGRTTSERRSVSFRRLIPTDLVGNNRNVFAGLNLPPDSAARRRLATLNEAELVAGQKRAQAQRNFLAYAERTKGDVRTSSQLLGQLPDVLRELRPQEGSIVLRDLMAEYRSRSQFELAESTGLELIRKYPDEPAALDAMRWLLQYWTSAEVSWQRTRGRGQAVNTATNSREGLDQRVQQAAATRSQFLTAPQTIADVVPAKATSERQTKLDIQRANSAGLDPDSPAMWQKRATELAQQLEDQAPSLFAQPSIQFPLAALRRVRSGSGTADSVYRSFQMASPEDATRQLVDRELWLGHLGSEVPRHIAICKSTRKRPHLDGLLSEECWQQATEIPILAPSTGGEEVRSGLMMLAHDDQFLYVAASLVKHPEVRNVEPNSQDRDHDADLTGHDRLSLALDIDRDYATWYSLEVDQRGQTSDRCWEDTTWNPRWYVAVSSESDRWRIELAIPWSELCQTPPQPREVWALGAVRTIPLVGHHGWITPASWPPRWDSLGLVRFE